MHMPGHKRNAALAPYLAGLGAGLDITEISGFDNLRAPDGILKDGMAMAARLYGAAASFYLVGGSTAGILAGIRALSQPGDQVLLPRASHLSIYQAMALCELEPRFLYPPMIKGFPAATSLPPSMLEDALKQAPGAKLLVLTSPSYQGVLEDLPSLVNLAHSHGLKVLVDAAHGAHLGLSDAFPAGAVASGADIVVQSLHKTLPSLTQTAIAHAADAQSAARLREQLDIFQTSSPSYLLMASIDGCLRLMLERGETLLQAWRDALHGFDRQIQPLRHLQLLGRGAQAAALHPELHGLDPSKLWISCAEANISGLELEARLREAHGIELEMADSLSALAMTGLGDDAASLTRLADALLSIDAGLRPMAPRTFEPLPAPERLMPAHRALRLPCELLPFAQAAGRCAAEYLAAYPPGQPLLIPGERVSETALLRLASAGSLVRTRSKGLEGQIAVLRL